MTDRQIIVLGFATILLAMAIVDVALRLRPGPPGSLAEALTAATRTVPGRAVVLAVWCWLGWHFLAR